MGFEATLVFPSEYSRTSASSSGCQAWAFTGLEPVLDLACFCKRCFYFCRVNENSPSIDTTLELDESDVDYAWRATLVVLCVFCVLMFVFGFFPGDPTNEDGFWQRCFPPPQQPNQSDATGAASAHKVVEKSFWANLGKFVSKVSLSDSVSTLNNDFLVLTRALNIGCRNSFSLSFW